MIKPKVDLFEFLAVLDKAETPWPIEYSQRPWNSP
jgi:hypothetical protein